MIHGDRFLYLPAAPLLAELDARNIDHSGASWATRAEDSGLVSIYTVDWVCCDLLLQHPYQIYGNDWFHPIEKVFDRPECGTTAGYWRHRKAGEPVDAECRLAYNQSRPSRKKEAA